MRVGPYDGKYDQCLVDVSDRGTYQFILSFQDFRDVSRLLLFIQRFYNYIIPHQRLNLLLAERAFGLTFINTGFYYMYVVESGNTLYYLSLHISILSASFASVTGCFPSLRHRAGMTC